VGSSGAAGRSASYEDPFALRLIGSDGAKDLMQDETSYVCNSCGEEIVVPVDLSAGLSQEYAEDCPVCCRPNLIHIEVDESGEVRAWSETEAD
jgi:hypothetical protein